MDRAKSKKIRNIRVIATNIFMCISVVVIVFILMLVAMGFSFNETGKFEQFGYVQLVSRPSDAAVSIDNKDQFGHTELSKLLSGGEHSVIVSKPGYDTWSQTLKVDAGLLTRVDWIRLFPSNPETSTVATIDNLRFANFSSNRKYLVAASKNDPYLYRYNIQDNEPHADKISLSDCLGKSSENVKSGIISIIAWNDNNNKLIVKWTSADNKTHSWHVVDLDQPKNSINLTEKYNLAFDSVLAANSSASKLWTLEHGTLRLIDTNNSNTTSPIAENIIKIAHNHDIVSFIKYTEPESDKDKNGNDNNSDQQYTYSLNTYREGEESYVHIADLDDTNKDSTIKLVMGSYWNEDWLAYSVDKRFTVISGKYPSYSKTEKKISLKSIFSQTLDELPVLTSINPPQRIITIANDKSILSYDIETKTSYSFDIASPLTNINWLDDYLIWQNLDNAIVVRDFDGNNRRKVISDVDNPFPVIISENNRYLYYFNIVEEEVATDSNNQPSDSDPVTTTETAIKYNLKRIKLQ